MVYGDCLISSGAWTNEVLTPHKNGAFSVFACLMDVEMEVVNIEVFLCFFSMDLIRCKMGLNCLFNGFKHEDIMDINMLIYNIYTSICMWPCSCCRPRLFGCLLPPPIP